MTSQVKTFTPSPKYLTKLRIELSLIALSIWLGGMFIGLLVSFEEGFGAFFITFFITTGLDLLWFVPGMLLTAPYYRSLRYEIHDDEMIVNVGVWTKSVKHVPFRTMTNLTVKRGMMERWFDLGTLDIQTAGMSDSTGGAEQSLVGLENAQEVYEIVVSELRRFRGAQSPTAADTEVSADALSEILEEVRAIRQTLEQAG